jgi:hypothetical protein
MPPRQGLGGSAACGDQVEPGEQRIDRRQAITVDAVQGRI